MHGILSLSTAIGTTAFCSITLVEKGVILNTKKKNETMILFSELNKINIIKHKFNFLNKLVILFLLLLFTAILSIYLPLEIVSLSTILLIPLIVKVNTYKRYQLNLRLHDGTVFKREFNNHTKQEYINLVNLVRKEIFDNQIKYVNQKETALITENIAEDYSFATLSIS